MSGKCRPSLRHKTLDNVRRSNLSQTDKDCIVAVFERLERIVPCEKCDHYHRETGFCNKHSYFVDSDGMSCSPAESPNWTVWEENDFCSYGERKDGVEDV